jgi:lipopolysaccharide assembly outer membrane protein LptD (OstA)
MTNGSMAVGFSLNNKEKQRIREKYDVRSPYDPIYMNMPWDISINYTLSYSNPNIATNRDISQVVRVQGSLNLTQFWDIRASTNYDIETRKLGFTQLRLYRDLNCWEMNFSIVPFGPRKNYSFGLNLKPQMLKDLKLERQRNWIDLQN